MGSVKNQNCVLVLDDLSDMIVEDLNTNEKFVDEEDVKTDDVDEARNLKEQIINIREDLKNNKKNKVIDNLKDKLSKAHGVDSKYIRINDIYYGSAHIDYDIIITLTKRGNVKDFSDELRQEFTAYEINF